MIRYFVTRRHPYTVLPFLEKWPNSVRNDFKIVFHEDLPFVTRLDAGPVIFTDLDRLWPANWNNALRLSKVLIETFGSACVLNAPDGVLLRNQLLQTLWSRGINRFRAVRCSQSLDELRYPVFVRDPNDHHGPRTPLLNNRAELDAAIAQLVSKGYTPGSLTAIEYIDTRDEQGLFRKYSAFRIGDAIIPAHILTSPDWVTKDSPPAPMLGYELAYLETNPHREQLHRVFDLAGVQYGRIDYGLKDGQIQIWEVNTNPVIVQEREKYWPAKLPMKQKLVDQISAAFAALIERVPAGSPQWVDIPTALLDHRSCGIRTRLRRKLWPKEV